MHDLDRDTREALWCRVGELLEAHAAGLREAALVPASPVAPARFAWENANDPHEVLEEAFRATERGVVPVDHPRYFGLFNPAPAALAVLADTIVSALNPQLATRSHAPWPVAAEEELLRDLGTRFGWPREQALGTFTGGGGEANLTALLLALHRAFPAVAAKGVRAIPSDPRVYVSAEGHATVTRAARVAGLGAESVCAVPSDAHSRIKVPALREAIAKDRAEGRCPFLIVGTAGTTSAGAIDPLAELATVAARAGCWFHVDAAWGGLAALVPELAGSLAGVESADSITFDPHKVLAAPMGTGALLVRHAGALEQVFADRSGYMPREGSGDPYARGLAWSRRFVGLRVLLPLAAAGWEGYAVSLRRQVALADRLREGLRARGWHLVNETPLPVVCFVDAARRDGKFLDSVARALAAEGSGWLSVPRFANGGRALRACVNNHRTTEGDIDALLAGLDRAREAA